MLYFRRRDGGEITPSEVLDFACCIKNYNGGIEIPELKEGINDIHEVLGGVLLTPYNGHTIGVLENEKLDTLRNKVIITILKEKSYEVTSMPSENWSSKRVRKFMKLSEGELSASCIYLPEK